MNIENISIQYKLDEFRELYLTVSKLNLNYYINAINIKDEDWDKLDYETRNSLKDTRKIFNTIFYSRKYFKISSAAGISKINYRSSVFKRINGSMLLIHDVFTRNEHRYFGYIKKDSLGRERRYKTVKMRTVECFLKCEPQSNNGFVNYSVENFF